MHFNTRLSAKLDFSCGLSASIAQSLVINLVTSVPTEIILSVFLLCHFVVLPWFLCMVVVAL